MRKAASITPLPGRHFTVPRSSAGPVSAATLPVHDGPFARLLTSFAVVALWLAAIGPAPAFAADGATTAGAAIAATEPVITTENPSRGVYRLRATITTAASVDSVLRMLSDVEAQCEADCRYPVPAIDECRIVDRETTEQGERLWTWTRIDDVMNATYWTSMWVERSGLGGQIRYSTPSAEELAEMADSERPHEPYFHHQAGTWTIEPWTPPSEPSSASATGSADSGVHITVEMEAHSDRFLINMAPGLVTQGMARQVEVLFGHIADLAAESLPANTP